MGKIEKIDNDLSSFMLDMGEGIVYIDAKTAHDALTDCAFMFVILDKNTGMRQEEIYHRAENHMRYMRDDYIRHQSDDTLVQDIPPPSVGEKNAKVLYNCNGKDFSVFAEKEETIPKIIGTILFFLPFGEFGIKRLKDEKRFDVARRILEEETISASIPELLKATGRDRSVLLF